MTQVGQYAYHPKRFDEPSRLVPFVRLDLHPVASYWRKTVWEMRKTLGHGIRIQVP